MPASPSGWASSWKATGATRIGISSWAAEDGRPGRDLGDVDQHPRPQFPALEGFRVPAQRALVSGAAGEIAVRPRLELLGGQPLEIGDVERVGDAGRLFGQGLPSCAHAEAQARGWSRPSTTRIPMGTF